MRITTMSPINDPPAIKKPTQPRPPGSYPHPPYHLPATGWQLHHQYSPFQIQSPTFNPYRYPPQVPPVHHHSRVEELLEHCIKTNKTNEEKIAAYKSNLADVKQKLGTSTKNIETVRKDLADKDAKLISTQLALEEACKEKETANIDLTVVKNKLKHSLEFNNKLESKIAEMTKNEAIYFEERKKFEAAKEKESAASYHNYNLQQEVSVLREQLDQQKAKLDTSVGRIAVQAKTFRELSMQYLHVSMHQEKQKLQLYQRKTVKFVKKLEEELLSCPGDIVKQRITFKIIDYMNLQIKTIENCHHKLEDDMQTLMDKVHSGNLNVSDLDYRLEEPHFHIPLNNFKSILLIIKRYGRFNVKTKDGLVLSDVMKELFSAYY